MLKSLLVSVLERNLGHFIETDTKSLKIGLWNGKIRMDNVALRPEALYTLGLPLSVKAGRVEKLELDIPWRHLGREKVVIKLSGISATVGTLGEDGNFTDERLRSWAWHRKKYQLQQLEEQAALGEEAQELVEQRAAAKKEQETAARNKAGRRASLSSRARGLSMARETDGSSEKKKKNGIGGRLRSHNSFLSKILDNLMLELDTVHLRIEGTSRRPFALGITLDALRTTEGDQANMRRVVLSGFTIYHAEPEARRASTTRVSFGGAAAPASAPAAASSAAAPPALAYLGRTSVDLSSESRRTIIEPATLVVCLAGPSIRERVLAAASGVQPAVGVDLDLSDLIFSLTQGQVTDISRLVAMIIETGEAIRRRELSLMLKDRVQRPETFDAKSRWRCTARNPRALSVLLMRLLTTRHHPSPLPESLALAPPPWPHSISPKPSLPPLPTSSYAIQRVILEVSWRKGWRLSPTFFAERRAIRLRYAALYRKSKMSKTLKEVRILTLLTLFSHSSLIAHSHAHIDAL